MLIFFKNRFFVFKWFFRSFVAFLINRDLLSLYLFIDYFFYFIFGTRFTVNKIFHGELGIHFFDRGYFYDFKIFRLPKIKNFNLERLLFLENIYFFMNKDKNFNFFDDDHCYEKFGVEICDGDIMIDAGAHIGSISAYGAYKGATVYAFEPIAETIEKLQETILLNKDLKGEINIQPFALSDKIGILKFNSNDEYSENSSSISYLKDNREYKQKEVEVNSVSLDEWVEKNNIKKIDFIKADIEGAERYMLLGAKKVLRDMKPKLSICTYHLPDDKEVLEKIVLEANPNYKIFHGKSIMYAK
jgi:FkbM family methyltransferase